VPEAAEGPSIPAAPPGSPFHALLGALQLESRLRLIAGSRVERLGVGETALTAGQHVESLSVVLEGYFRVEVPDRHGLPIEVATFAPGDYFGEMSFLRGERASATVRASIAAAVLRIPHTLLAEVAANDASLMRELARVVAVRLSATNERFRALRPGRAVACTVAGASWEEAALVQVARSASFHAGSPTLVVDLRRSGPVAGAAPLPPLSGPAQSEAIAAIEGFAAQSEDAVGWTPAAGMERGELIQAVSRLQSRFPLVLVLCSDGEPPGVFDGPVSFARQGPGPSGPTDSVDVVLAAGDVDARPAGVARLAAARGSNVLAVFGGGERALQGQRSWPAASEPWHSIDRVARRLLRRSTGLALGAGGAKGYAHIGVARALRAMGVPIDYVAGSSIGAPIAAGISVGMLPGALKRELDSTFSRALRPVVPYQSFLSSRRIVREMDRLVAGRGWDDVEVPLAVVAVDLDMREEVVLRDGPPARTLAASMAIPGIFAPIEVNGRRLVDGGLLNPVPTATVAALGADIVIGVKLTDPPRGPRPQGRPRYLLRGAPPILDHVVSAIDIMQMKIIADGAAQADVTITPEFKSPVGLRDFRRGAELLAAGEDAAWAQLSRLQELLPWLSGVSRR
jgi:NTE family protein